MRAAGPRVLLLVDFRNQIYKAAASHGSLFSGRTFTGGLYGFLVSMCRAIRDVGATQVVVATDTQPYQRRLDFPGYKSDRAKARSSDDPKEKEALMNLMKATSSFALAEAFLTEAIRVPIWAVKGFEYDDICAWAAAAFSPRFDSIVAMTNDTDLYQCFDILNFSIYKGAEKGIYGPEEYKAEFPGLTRADWVMSLAMMGTHNAVPGIEGIGPVKALKALRDPSQAVYRKHIRTITRNLDLIRLPHPDFPRRPDLRLQRHRFSLRDVQAFCARYEIRLTQKIVEALQDIRHIDNDE